MNTNYSGEDFRGKSFKNTGEDFRDANFRAAQLQGANFEGLDLSEANFAYADIRGANFRNTILSNADFSYVKAGLNSRFMILASFLALFFILLTIPVTLMAGVAIGSTIYIYGKQGLPFGLITFFIFYFLFILRGTDVALKISIYSVPILIALVTFFALFVARQVTQMFSEIFVSIIVSISLGLITIWNSVVNAVIFIYFRALLGKIGAIIIGVIVLFIIVFITMNVLVASHYRSDINGNKVPNDLVHFEITDKSLEKLKIVGVPGEVIDKLEKLKNREYHSENTFIAVVEEEVGQEQFIKYKLDIVESSRTFRGSTSDIGSGAFFTAVVVDILIITASLYASWRAVIKEKKHSLILKVATRFASKGGTSFENADLSDAHFEGVTLRSTNFSGAHHTQTCYWTDAKDLEFAKDLIPFRE